MRVALLQTEGRGQKLHDNLSLLEDSARSAAAHRAQLLVTPEMFLSGYNIPPGALRASARPRDAALKNSLSDIARDTGVALVVGYPELEDDCVYNSALLVDGEGRERLNHRKSHLFGDLDHRAFSAGDGQVQLARLGEFRVGLLICYDVEFPETVRTLALAGADLVIVPTALMQPYAFVAEHMVPTRAYENQLFMIYANRCGQEGDLHYQGMSCIVGPDGRELARAGSSEELITADIDHSALAPSRALNAYLRDRRPRLYRDLVARG